MKASLPASKPEGLSVVIGVGNTPLLFSAKSQVPGVDVEQLASVRPADLLLRTEQYLYQEDGYNSFFQLGQDGKSLMEFRGMKLDPIDFQNTILNLLTQSAMETNDPRLSFMMRFEAKKFAFDSSDPRSKFVAMIQNLKVVEMAGVTRWLASGLAGFGL